MVNDIMLDQNLLRQQLQAKISQVYELGQQENLVDGYRITVLVSESIDFYRRYWGIDFSDLYPSLIAAQPAYQLMISTVSRQLANARMPEAAALIAGTAAAFNVPGNVLNLLHAAALRNAGDLSAARAIANHLLADRPDDGDAITELAECDVEERFSQQSYYDVLNSIHIRLKPATYLEIGVAQGRSLALVRQGTTSIGVDPDTGEHNRLFFHSLENAPQLFRMTSDDFFASHNLSSLLGAPSIDVAFLDGLHLFEQTLKDFINVERCANKDSVILIHDCLPVNALVAEKKRQSAFWLGDVWKIIPCLKAIRPDLDIVTLPVKPSGLAVIRNLDPSSRILERQFNSITEHFNTLTLPESWDDTCNLCCVTDQSPEQLLGIAGVGA